MLVCPDEQGESSSVCLSGLDEVAVITTDEGPFVEDVFWALRTREREVLVPQGVAVFDSLFDVFIKWPGFDEQPFIKAMCCARNGKFVCWRRVSR